MTDPFHESKKAFCCLSSEDTAPWRGERRRRGNLLLFFKWSYTACMIKWPVDSSPYPLPPLPACLSLSLMSLDNSKIILVRREEYKEKKSTTIVDADNSRYKIYLFYITCRFLFQSPIVHLVGLSFMACLDPWFLQISLFNAEIHSHACSNILTNEQIPVTESFLENCWQDSSVSKALAVWR